MADEQKKQENEESRKPKTKGSKNIWFLIFLTIVGINVVRVGLDWMKSYPVDSATQNYNEIYRAFKDGKLDTTEAIENALTELKENCCENVLLKEIPNLIGVLEEFRKDGQADLDEALKHYRIASDIGLGRGSYNVARIYEQETHKDQLVALHYYNKAGEQGFLDGWLRLGNIYLNDQGLDPDLDKAFSFYQKAGDAGSLKAKYKALIIARDYDAGVPIEKIMFYARDLLQANYRPFIKMHAMALAIPDSFPDLGYTANPELSFDYYSGLAEEGDIEATRELALLLQSGAFGETRIKEAEEFFVKAAEGSSGFDRMIVAFQILLTAEQADELLRQSRNKFDYLISVDGRAVPVNYALSRGIETEVFTRIEQGMYSSSTLEYVFDQSSLAATEGSPHAAFYAAMLEYYGALGDVNYANVRDNVEKAVSGGVKEGLIFNAMIYWDDEFGMKDTERALDLIETAMDLSVPGAFAQYLTMSFSMDSMDIRGRGDVIDGLREEAVQGSMVSVAFLAVFGETIHPRNDKIGEKYFWSLIAIENKETILIEYPELKFDQLLTESRNELSDDMIAATEAVAQNCIRTSLAICLN